MKVNGEISICTAIMLNNRNPEIENTTVLCDTLCTLHRNRNVSKPQSTINCWEPHPLPLHGVGVAS